MSLNMSYVPNDSSMPTGKGVACFYRSKKRAKNFFFNLQNMSKTRKNDKKKYLLNCFFIHMFVSINVCPRKSQLAPVDLYIYSRGYTQILLYMNISLGIYKPARPVY